MTNGTPSAYLGSEYNDQHQRSGKLTAGKLEQEQVIGVLDDPRDAAQDAVADGDEELAQNGQEEAQLFAVMAGRVACA